MSKMIFFAIVSMTTMIGLNVNAMMILPTHPEMVCSDTHQYLDSGMTLKIEYAPSQQTYIMNIEKTTFAGKQTIREEAKRLETKQPGTPIIYSTKSYMLTVGTSLNPSVGYSAILKQGQNQAIPLNCRPVR